MIETEQTIVAIASPPSPAPRGIVRLSGDDVADVLTAFGVELPASRFASRFAVDVSLGDPLGDVPVDVMYWPTRRSYTGQPSAEIHTCGSIPVLQRIVDALIGSGGRAARPGEFTMRAFLAGRLDLTQAEAVLGVIEAEQRGTLDHALRQLAGNLSRPLEHMRSEMLDLLADVEAGLDFVDEDIEFISEQVLVQRLTVIRQTLAGTLSEMQDRGGGAAKPTIALRGQPNAGKSQLINRLAGHDATIVADVAGTTRDSVLVDAAIGEQAVQLIDTAGIEDRSGVISGEAQRQAVDASRHAAIRLWCVDSSREDFAAAATELAGVCAQDSVDRRGAIDLWVATKSDLQPMVPAERLPTTGRGRATPWISTSAVSGAGIETLRTAIQDALESVDRGEAGSVLGTATRCRASLHQADAAVEAAIALAGGGDGQEFVAAELRTAVEVLGEVTGTVYTDDILDRVFGRFCIGK